MTEDVRPPVKVALIIDGEVIDVLHTDDRLAAILLSDPVVVDVTDWFKNNPDANLVGRTYDGANFSTKNPPVPIKE